MWKFEKVPDLSEDKIKELKNQWFTIEEAIDELAINGEKMSESAFRQGAKEVNLNKEFSQIGKPGVKIDKSEGRGRPRKLYNRAFIESIRTFANSDTYKKIEEGPVDYFLNSNWKEEIEEEFRDILNNYIDKKEVYGVVTELSRIIGERIIQKYNPVIGQNKLLIHQNKKLEDTKEYYIAMYNGVEENANILNEIAMFIKNDISEASQLLSRKEAHHTMLTSTVDNKLDRIEKLLEDIKNKNT